jgi:hypothetical protein
MSSDAKCARSDQTDFCEFMARMMVVIVVIMNWSSCEITTKILWNVLLLSNVDIRKSVWLYEFSKMHFTKVQLDLVWHANWMRRNYVLQTPLAWSLRTSRILGNFLYSVYIFSILINYIQISTLVVVVILLKIKLASAHFTYIWCFRHIDALLHINYFYRHSMRYCIFPYFF